MPFSWKIYLSGDRTAEDGLVIPVGAGGGSQIILLRTRALISSATPLWLHRDECHQPIRVPEAMGHRNLPLPDARPCPCTQAAAASLLAPFLVHFLIYNLMTEQHQPLYLEPGTTGYRDLRFSHHVRSSMEFGTRESWHVTV